MKEIEAVQILEKSGKKIFTLSEIKSLFGIEKDNTLYKKVESLIKDKILTRAIKGIYYLTLNPPSDFELANFLYQPSYISLSSALNFYGILVQVPYELTSVTPRLSRKIKIGERTFKYFHIKKDYFWSYEKENEFLIASPEKALVDTLFLISLGRLFLSYDEFLLDKINKKKFAELSKKIKHPAYQKLILKIKL